MKRITPVWNGLKFYEFALSFYEALTSKISSAALKKNTILRIFNSVEEQNEWFVACDQKELGALLSEEMVPNTIESLRAPLGFGRVLGSFQLNTHVLLDDYQQFLSEENVLMEEEFHYHLLQVRPEGLQYKDFIASKIVFAEGTAAIQNPFFPQEGLIPKKGEYITIKAPQLHLEDIVKGSYFIIPLGNDCYKVGATFAHQDTSFKTTEAGKETLIMGLKKAISVPFEVVNQEFGFRPTVSDRKPMIGNLPSAENIYFLNGLGTRGFLMAPLLSSHLFYFMEGLSEIPSEMDIRRFS
ncbi:MAG: FAD-dependent oxidoreductase [Flavobacteriaceae bacterium]